MNTASNHSIYARWNPNTYTVTFNRTNFGNGEVVYFNPVTAKVCDASESVSTTGYKDGCMKWYAFLDDGGDKIKLLLDHNISEGIAWNVDETATTPDTVNAQLRIDVSNWNDTIKSSARLLSAEELNQIVSTNTNWNVNDIDTWYYLHTGNHSSYEGKASTNYYAWLFDNTGGCTRYGCNVEQSTNNGYWMSSYSEEGYAWEVHNNGGMARDLITVSNKYGVRPVIEINKSLLKTTKEVTYDNTYGTLPILTKPGYAFQGWYTTGGVKIDNTTKVQITSNQTLYAQWIQNDYNVTFDANGGNIPNGIQLTNLVLNGSFENNDEHWYMWETSVTNSIAKFGKHSVKNVSPNEYRAAMLTYQNSYIDMNPNHKYYVSAWIFTVKGSCYNDFSFEYDNTNHWQYINSDLGKKNMWVRTSNIFTSPNVQNIKAGFAIADSGGFDKECYGDGVMLIDLTSTFGIGNEQNLGWLNKNIDYFDGTNSIKINNVKYNQNYGELPIPTKEGYTFNGWYTTGGIKITSDMKVNISSDHKLYAQWVKNVYEFSYINSEQTFVTPLSGNYKIEVWGAQGGSNMNSIGGYGAYSVGTIYLTQNETLYINVGGAGLSAYENGEFKVASNLDRPVKGGYNGGGDDYQFCEFDARDTMYGTTGGGATHIATHPGLLSSLENYKNDILIVGAGGGGSSYWPAKYFTDDEVEIPAETAYPGGSGGGFKGVGSNGSSSNQIGILEYNGGTQTSGGNGSIFYYNINNLPEELNVPSEIEYLTNGGGTFGQGGNGLGGLCIGAGGGGGYYGGTGGYDNSAGAGGSSYIGNINLFDKSMYCYNCETNDDTNTKTISTNNVSETATANYAKIGNGYARITYLGE